MNDAPASLKRQVLALYIDFLLFTALLLPIRWLVGDVLGRGTGIASVLLFAVVRYVLGRSAGTAPGRWALGIEPGPLKAVDSRVRATGTWWTIAGGVFLVLDGSKNLVRWTQGLPPVPWFGDGVSDSTALIVTSAMGLVAMAAGVFVLRTHPSGAGVGAGLTVAQMLLTLLNADAMRVWAGSALQARRALQGRSVSADEVAFAERFVVAGGIVFSLGLTVLLLLAWKRFTRPVAAQQ